MATARTEPPVDRDSPIPIFEQIKDRLEGAIAAGALVANGRIPSERELSSRYGVSRMTIRQAIGALVRTGTLYARSGKGTFVAERKIEQPLQRLSSFTEDMRARGLRPSSRLLGAERVSAQLEVAHALGLPPGSQLIRITRLRLANDEPLALEASHLPEVLCPNILDHDLANRSLYEILLHEYGIALGSARQAIEASAATRNERDLLAIPAGVPVLRIRRLTFDAAGAAVEFVMSAYRGDRYQLQVELR
jgi:GntR family transcriptional regulator